MTKIIVDDWLCFETKLDVSNTYELESGAFIRTDFSGPG